MSKVKGKGKRINSNIMIRCKICDYVFMSPAHDKAHERHCRRFQAAVALYGNMYIMTYPVEEALKREAHLAIRKKELPVTKRAAAAITVMRAWFSRSVRTNKYRLNHPALPEYVGMILNHGQRYSIVKGEVYWYLVDQYGIMAGMQAGSSYWPRLKNVIIPRGIISN